MLDPSQEDSVTQVKQGLTKGGVTPQVHRYLRGRGQGSSSAIVHYPASLLMAMLVSNAIEHDASARATTSCAMLCVNSTSKITQADSWEDP